MAIDLTTFFDNLGIASGNTSAENQYEFYNGIVWTDTTTTYNQYEFYKKLITDNRYEFYKQYTSEYAFYKNTSDSRVIDFYTFYQFAGEYLVGTLDNWILYTGRWNDDGIWVDVAIWNDGV